MPRKRQYKVRGTNDFLVMAIIFFFLGIWAVKDAWFPSESVQKRHPSQVEIKAEMDGFIKTLHVAEGDVVTPPTEEQEWSTKLLEFNGSALEKEIAARQQMIKDGTGDLATLRGEITQLQNQLDQYTVFCPKLGKDKSGQVEKILVEKLAQVKAGDTLMIIKPKTSFYVFNKSLTVVSAIIFLVLLGVHLFGR